MDDTQDNAAQPDPAAANSAGYPTYHHSSDTNVDVVREQIADRTGELMKTAFNVASEEMRAQAGLINDPRDGTAGHFVITRTGVVPIPPLAWDGYRQFPLFRQGTAKLTQLASFVALVNRFKLSHSAIFACDDFKNPRLTAIFDYHPDNADILAEGDGVPAQVQNMHHKAEYAFPLSEEWKAWTEKNAEPMGMGEFARFLEDHIVDVSSDPVEAFSQQSKAFVAANRGSIASPTKLIEISLGLKVYENSVVREAKNLSTGESQFTFDAEHTDADGKPLTLPTMFSIVIPVFARSEDLFRLIARFRYRKTPAGLVFWYELWRPDLTFETAFNEAIDVVAARTDLPVYAGAPEA